MTLGHIQRRSAPIALVALGALVHSLVHPIVIYAQASEAAAEGIYSQSSLDALGQHFRETGAEPAQSAEQIPGLSDVTRELADLAQGGAGGQSVALPGGAATALGMGESFTTQLSTGVAAFGIPLSLPSARGGVQPKLELSYNSAGGWGVAGIGWSIGASAISRQTDRGLPKYDDRAGWHAEQDRFVFGGMELVPICTVNGGSCAGALAGEIMPAWSHGWQYFRARIEGGFLRFFWSPDHRTWRVQGKDGTNLELGVPLDGTSYEGALERNPDDAREIFRWYLARQYDSQGGANDVAGPSPVNTIVYRYVQDGGATYLSDIFDTSPAQSPTTTDLARYAHHTRIAYEARPDVVISYRAGWRVEHRLRAARVDVTSKTFAGAVTTPRELVRRYHLGYDADSHASLLASVQMEGRCSSPVQEEAGQGLPVTSCPRLPAMTFEYQRVSGPGDPLRDSRGYAFERFNERVEELSNSPPHSLDEPLTELMDVNADGLPDVLVTAPGLFGGRHGVFLSGLDPGGFVGFGVAQTMAVDTSTGIDAGVLQLGNPNVSALDLDADGIANLVHMPARRDYAVFSPVTVNGTPAWPGGAYRWQGRRVVTASRQDVKIDFTSRRADIRVMDVNGDGLVDVVYSAPTEMQTFLALGRYPGGDDQFGQARWTSASTAELSNEPVTACSPWSSTPARFRDPDVFLADMNGDGLVDIARVRDGQAIYWPGRGNGYWGTGDRDGCLAGGFAVDRHVAMGNAPRFGVTQPGTLLVNDVNGDGFADLVEVRNQGVDIYLNESGQGWTARHIIADTPFRPSASNYVRLSDIDGSGTPDIVWGRAYEYRYIDLTGGVTPHLMVKAHNGLGKTLELEYDSSTQVMLRAAVDGDPWRSWAPTTLPVLVRSTVRDNLEAVGRPAGVYTTEYSYRDPVFDGRQREFRGFREAVVKTLGDSSAPTSSQRTVFLLGECPEEFKGTQSDVCSPAERWQDNWREALKGLPAVSETFDEQGVYLMTQHTGYELRQLYTGLDGRRVVVAYPSNVDAYSYDTKSFDGSTSVITAPEVEVSLAGIAHTESRSLAIRAQAGTARVRSESQYDDFGNTTIAIKRGCVEGCPAGADESILANSEFMLPPGDGSGWLWRESGSYITGSVHTELREQTTHSFDATGKLLQSHALLSGTLPLARFHAASAPVAPAPPAASSGVSEAVSVLLVDNTYDMFGRARERSGALGRCSEVDTDLQYSQIPIATRSFVDEVGGNGCGTRVLEAHVVDFDRGLGLVLESLDPTGQPARSVLDGFGRLIAVFDTDPDNPGQLSPLPSVTVEYELTANPEVQPYSLVHVRAQDGVTPSDDSYREGWCYIDGLGRTLASLSQADPSAGDEGQWVSSGAVLYNRKGTASLSYLPWFYSGTPQGLNIQHIPSDFTFSEYDAFGRVRNAYGLDGEIQIHHEYRALSEDVHDAADLSLGERQGTPMTVVSDGHGRGRIRTERIHVNGVLQERYLLTEYLPTGEVERVIQRQQGSADVVRWLRYDSLGRMVLNVEPNTSTGFDPNPSADPAAIQAFRYAYNDAGDLVGTSDARGCGVNYHYDAGGRLIAEDRSPCLSHHAAYSAPNLATGAGTEAFYRYDVADPETGDIEDAADQPFVLDTSLLLGRLASVSDLSTKAVMRYDARGRSTGVALRVSKPGAPATALSERYTPRWYTRVLSLDAADRPTAVSTGATVAELLGGDGTSEVRYGYTKRGVMGSVGSSYGVLVSGSLLDAEGKIRQVTLGDAAGTLRESDYDINRRIEQVLSYRGNAAQWTTPSGYVPPGMGAAPTQQELLEHYAFEYDEVGNIVRADDLRVESEWPSGFKPVHRTYQYDDLYRLTQVSYAHTGSAAWVSPYAAENADSDREQPAPHVSFTGRPSEQSYAYDWLGNLSRSADDSHGFFDRSTGDRAHGIASAGPHQLHAASNRMLSSNGPRAGDLDVAYDAAGQVTGLIVRRDGACLPGGFSCWQRYHYEWDEIGELSRARRWDLSPSGPNERSSYGDLTDPLPPRAADTELRYAYDASGKRVLKSAQDDGGVSLHTVYVFDSLELRRTSYSSGDYTLNAQTASVRFGAGPASARVVYAQSDAVSGMSSSQRVFLELSDYLGSSTYLIDRATGELVEFSTYQAYGTTESDYRPERWDSFREPYKFTGKEEDIAVGLSYFGARYYSPHLGVWLSPDPVTIHELGSDTNPYAYVMGRPVMAVDPDGRIAFLAVVAIAAVVSTAASITAQAATVGWSNIDWGLQGVTGAFITGAVAGSVGGALGGLAVGAFGAPVGGALTGAASSISSYLVGSAINGFRGANWESLGRAVGIGALGGFIGASVGDILPRDAWWSQPTSSAAATVASFGITSINKGKFEAAGFAVAMGSSIGSSVAVTLAASPAKTGEGFWLESADDSSGDYQLTRSAKDILRPYYEKMGVDLDSMRYRFVEDIPFGTSAYTVGNRVVIDAQDWRGILGDPFMEFDLLAHETAHSVQYKMIADHAGAGVPNFLSRYFLSGISDPSQYRIYNYSGTMLRNVPLSRVNPIDPRFSLDQLAEAIKDKFAMPALARHLGQP